MSQSLLNFGERRCGYQVYATLDSGATDFAVWRFWWAISAVHRIGYTQAQMTSHGFRSMAATRLNEVCRWHPDVIERALAHQDADPVRRAYTSAVEYWPERVELGRVDGFDQDEGAAERHERSIVPRRFLAA